jgi:hypothetical protein
MVSGRSSDIQTSIIYSRFADVAHQRIKCRREQLSPAQMRGSFSPMTRIDIIQANDQLRTALKGGRIEVCHGPYDLDDRLIGRMLCVLARYDRFEQDSLHDAGVFIFSGFSFEFHIEEIDRERVLRVWVTQDVLNGTV